MPVLTNCEQTLEGKAAQEYYIEAQGSIMELLVQIGRRSSSMDLGLINVTWEDAK